jgi:phosphotriesterase-related protein
MKRRYWYLAAIATVTLSGLGLVKGQQADRPAPVTGKILTVKGPISPEQLGQTLMHEHIFIDFTVPVDTAAGWQYASRTKPTGATEVALYNAPLTMDLLGAVTQGAPNRDNWLLNDEKLAIDEVRRFQAAGGNTIVDVTSIGLKRDPEALLRVSQATGMNVVMGAAWYRKGWSGHLIANRSVESLTEEIVRDVTVGVGNTGIRAGIIGEVGTEGNPLVQTELNNIRAAGRASRLTGAAVTLHTSALLKEQPRILDMLAEEGADLSRVVVGHSNPIANDLPFMKKLLDRGAYVQFDLLGRTPTPRTPVSDAEVGKGIVAMIKAGYLNKILLSQDICTKVQLSAYGGTGFAYISEYFLPYLKRLGVTDQQIETIVVENPRRVLTFVAPRT